MPLLDRLYTRSPTDLERVFARAAPVALGAWLEQLSASLVELASRGTPPEERVGQQSSSRVPELFARALVRDLPTKSEAELHRLGLLLTWSADGLLEGAVPDVPPAEVRQGLVRTLGSIITGWGARV